MRYLRNISLALLLAAAPGRAGAAIVVVPVAAGPAYYYGYELLPEHIVVDQQYYDLSLGGIEQLCMAQPDLCAAPEQQARLETLRADYRTGVILIVSGIAAAVAGTTWSIAVLQNKNDYDANPLWRLPMAVGLTAGIVLPLTGSFIVPRRREVVGFVNQANVAHPDHHIRIYLGGVGASSAPGVALSAAL